MTTPARTTFVLALTLLGCAAGCSTSPRSARDSDEASRITSTRFTDDLPERQGRAVAASALVFDPPVTYGEPPLYLSRAERQPAAFFGYEEGFLEYYRLTVDDRQIGYGGYGGYGHGGGWGGGWYDRYERRAVSDKTGFIRR